MRTAVISGTVQVTVEARSAFGTSGLVREVTLRKPPQAPAARGPLRAAIAATA